MKVKRGIREELRIVQDKYRNDYDRDGTDAKGHSKIFLDVTIYIYYDDPMYSG